MCSHTSPHVAVRLAGELRWVTSAEWVKYPILPTVPQSLADTQLHLLLLRSVTRRAGKKICLLFSTVATVNILC